MNLSGRKAFLQETAETIDTETDLKDFKHCQYREKIKQIFSLHSKTKSKQGTYIYKKMLSTIKKIEALEMKTGTNIKNKIAK